jgi:hypothetical protein
MALMAQVLEECSSLLPPQLLLCLLVLQKLWLKPGEAEDQEVLEIWVPYMDAVEWVEDTEKVYILFPLVM